MSLMSSSFENITLNSLKHAPFFYIILNKQKEILYANQKTIDWFELNPADIVFTNVFDILPKLKKHSTIFENVLNSGNTELIKEEIENLNNDQFKTIFFEICKTSNEDFEGFTLIGYELHEIENLIKNQVSETQKMETMGLLARGFAHNFNNMLSGMLGYLELALFKEKNTEILPYLNKIKEIIESSSSLVKQILIFASTEKGNPEIISVEELIKEVVDKSKLFLERSIKIITSFEKQLDDFEELNIITDQPQTVQALLNLIKNLKENLKNQEDNQLIIKISKEIIEDRHLKDFELPDDIEKGIYVKTTISCGISDLSSIKDKGKFFEPFSISKVQKNVIDLGISIAQEIISQNKGFLTLHFDEGIISAVNIYLPHADEFKTTESETVPEEEEIYNVDEPVKNKTILYIEDEFMMREVAKEILNHLGYRLLLAEDGIEGLEMYEKYEQEIDLIILDLYMPRMDGIHILKILSEKKNIIPVLICSGFINAKVKELVSKTDFVKGIIHKPFNIGTIITELTKIFK